MIILVAILPIARVIILAFTPPEFFMVIMFGLASVVVTSRGNMIKGFISAGIGIILSFIGFCNVTGGVRYSFGSDYLWDGIKLVPVFIGIFAVSEALRLAVEKRETISQESIVATKLGGAWEGFKEVFKHMRTFIASSLGFFLVRPLVRITTVSVTYIIPTIVILSFAGVFAMRAELLPACLPHFFKVFRKHADINIY